MITAQDVREKTFEKSKFGGYDMAEVDEFLEQIADDLTASQKETAVLKSKMKILVDKIEEYRSNENAVNQAVLSAQKLAVQIESEARTKADSMLADAQAQVDEAVGSLREQTALEENKLAAAKSATEKFFDGLRAMCNAQLRNIDKIAATTLPEQGEHESEAEAPAAKAEEKAEEAAPATATNEDIAAAIRSIEKSTKRAKAASEIDLNDLDSASEAPDYDRTQTFSF